MNETAVTMRPTYWNVDRWHARRIHEMKWKKRPAGWNFNKNLGMFCVRCFCDAVAASEYFACVRWFLAPQYLPFADGHISALCLRIMSVWMRIITSMMQQKVVTFLNNHNCWVINWLGLLLHLMCLCDYSAVRTTNRACNVLYDNSKGCASVGLCFLFDSKAFVELPLQCPSHFVRFGGIRFFFSLWPANVRLRGTKMECESNSELYGGIHVPICGDRCHIVTLLKIYKCICGRKQPSLVLVALSEEAL